MEKFGKDESRVKGIKRLQESKRKKRKIGETENKEKMKEKRKKKRRKEAGHITKGGGDDGVKPR